jgi:hypothetical protein
MRKILLAWSVLLAGSASAQNIQNNPGSNHGNKFEQLGTILPTPNEYRTASGAPGPKYWQQRADYDIKCELDEEKLRLTGSETITYFNNSPDELTYLWFQLDENEHSSDRNANYQDATSLGKQAVDMQLDRMTPQKNDYGVNITKLTDATGKPLKYTINKTMMRVDLPTALKPGQKFIIKIDWNYKITDRIFPGRWQPSVHHHPMVSPSLCVQRFPGMAKPPVYRPRGICPDFRKLQGSDDRSC